MLRDYDYIIIGCPPSLGYLTINALCSATDVIITITPHYFPLVGTEELMDTINEGQKKLNKDLKILGILFTLWDKRNRLDREVIGTIKEQFKSIVFETMIPHNIRVAEAPSHRQSIYEYSPSSAGAKAYMSFTKEVLKNGR